jgi:hypothetical protein
LPVVIGEHTPKISAGSTIEVPQYAKFMRVSDGMMTWENQFLIEYPGDRLDPKNVTAFPVISVQGASPTLNYEIRFASIASLGTSVTANYFTEVYPEYDWYMEIIEGVGAGQFRRITAAQFNLTFTFTITVASYYEQNLAGAADAKAADQTWVRFIGINRKYVCDSWPIFSFLDEDGNAATEQEPTLYAYSDEKSAALDENGDATGIITEKPFQFLRLPEKIYVKTDSTKDEIEIDLMLFDSSPDNSKGFIILPLDWFNVKNPDTLESFRWSGLAPLSDYESIGGGLAYLYNADSPGWVTISATGARSLMTDRDSTTKYRISLSTVQRADTIALFVGVIMNMPAFPKGLTIDSAYLMLKLKSSSEDDLGGSDYQVQTGLLIALSRFMGYGKTIISDDIRDNYDDKLTGGEVNDSPDFYYSDQPENNNKYVYFESDDTSSVREITGYTKFKLPGVSNEKDYKNIYNLGIFVFQNWFLNSGLNAYVDFYQLGVMFERAISIKTEIYSPVIGRIYNDTWDGRKDRTAAISGIIGIYEMLCRLQSWADYGDTSTVAGTEYSPLARINKNHGPGGFDNPSLSNISSIAPAFMLDQESDMWTGNLKREWCRTFFMAGYSDFSGRESLEFLGMDAADVVPTDSITLLDIPEGMSAGQFETRRPEDIYCEPIIRFNRNPATGEYQSIFRILNSADGTWQQSFTPGIESGLAETLYNLAHGLWQRSRQINTMPDDVSSKWMINNDEDALWWLETYLRWQYIPWIPVPVYYEKARLWNTGKFVSLNLPHQTGGATRNCFIGEIERDFVRNSCSLKLFLLDSATDSIILNDTMSNSAPTWQDDMQTYVQRGNTGITDKQDI